MNIKKIAKKYKDIYFTPAHIKFNDDSCKFESKYKGEMFEKLCIVENNCFEFFLRGWNEAEKINTPNSD